MKFRMMSKMMKFRMSKMTKTKTPLNYQEKATMTCWEHRWKEKRRWNWRLEAGRERLVRNHSENEKNQTYDIDTHHHHLIFLI